MTVPGKWLSDQLHSRGGKDSEYTDEEYGTIQSLKPLSVRLSSNLLIPAGLVEVSGLAAIKVSGGQVGVVPLAVGDRVRLLRVQRGQRYLLLERM